ncbi:tubulin--tyrosine ligase-like protein 12 isoform X2 [Daphnia carinata]|nr:tubulin--tyrosine ligase-like protein 12 isoform X2 [Daphnia carinata]
MCNLMGVTYHEGIDNEAAIKEVMTGMWKYSQSYSIGNQNLEAEERLPIWYIMDEFGSRIQHADCATVRVVPFFYMTEQATYSIMFPITHLNVNDEVTRDFVEGSGSDEITRSALLAPWSSEFSEKFLDSVSLEQVEPSSDYFSASRMSETLPITDVEIPDLPKDQPIRTYVEYAFIRDYLKHPRFQLVDNPDEAEILWLSSHFKDFRMLSENIPFKRINQFPCEHLLTVKDLLCIIARRANKSPMASNEVLKNEPCWLPTTFNLKTELPKLVAYYMAQKKLGMPNLWIIKPWNLARSMDTHITDNLDMILRLAVSGPKICQKYIDRPVLFYREDISAKVKFDLRYIILLSSVDPLKAFVYRRFWIRFANRPFELDHFDEYERHFTVMNYSASNLHQMFCHDFVKYFEEQNPGQEWHKIEKRIFSMLSALLKASTEKTADTMSSLTSAPQSRAMYAVDLMLAWTDNVLDGDDPGPFIQPMLLEVNWAPDCKRACVYYKEFFDDVFSVLFLDETEGRHVQLLE